MIPPGFLGTGADLLVDLLIAAVPLVLVGVAVSWRLARRRRFVAHRNLQIFVGCGLTLAVIALEVHLKTSGGITHVATGRLVGTRLFWNALAVHLFFSISTAIIWIGLIAFSLLRFPRPPAPNAFSRTHRIWGWIGMMGMVGTGLSAIVFYFISFVL